LIKRKKAQIISNENERSLQDGQAQIGMGCTRVEDRVASAIGQMYEAPVEFQSALDVQLGGILFSLPGLEATDCLNQELHELKSQWFLIRGST
jgi:hypothetical protein